MNKRRNGGRIGLHGSREREQYAGYQEANRGLFLTAQGGNI